MAAAATTVILKADEAEAKRLQELIDRTNRENPRPEDLALLREAFDKAPTLAVQIGNVQQVIRNSIISGLTSHSALQREALTRFLDNMKSELGFETSSFVERLLIEEVVTRWVRLQQMENDHENVTYREHTFASGAYMEKRLHLTHKRYLASLEALAKVRKLIARTQAAGVEMYTQLTQGNEKAQKKDVR